MTPAMHSENQTRESNETPMRFEAALRATSTPPMVPGACQLRGSRVLIVDDHADSRDVLQCLLERSGASVTVKTSATSALESYAPHQFDVVVSDIGMPGMDGCDFMRELRTRDADTPALALSGYSRDEDTSRARSAGFQRHFAKPANSHDLIAALVSLVHPTQR